MEEGKSRPATLYYSTGKNPGGYRGGFEGTYKVEDLKDGDSAVTVTINTKNYGKQTDRYLKDSGARLKARGPSNRFTYDNQEISWEQALKVFNTPSDSTVAEQSVDSGDDAYSLGYGYFFRVNQNTPHPENPHAPGTPEHSRWRSDYEQGVRDRRNERSESVEPPATETSPLPALTPDEIEETLDKIYIEYGDQPKIMAVAKAITAALDAGHEIVAQNKMSRLLDFLKSGE